MTLQTNSNENHENLLLWLQEQGVDTKSLVLAQTPDMSRGLYAARDFKADEVLISVPEHLLITTQTAIKSAIGPTLLINEITDAVEILCLYLIFEKNTSSGFFKPYIEVLPTTFDTVMFFDLDELSEFQCHRKLASIKAKKNSIEETFESLKRKLEGETVFKPDWLTYSSFLWSWSCVMTRSVYVDWQSGFFDDIYALIPFADFLNHATVKSSGKFHKKKRCYSLVTHQGFKKGDQVFISYHMFGNYKLLKHYGFVIENNPYDEVQFFEPSENELDSVGSKFNIDVSFVKGKYFGSLSGFSWNYLNALRLWFLESPHVDDWKNVLDDEMISISNEIKTYKYLENTLQNRLNSYPTTLEEDNLLLERELPYRRKCTVQVRRRGKQILQHLLQLSREQLVRLSVQRDHSLSI